MTSFHKLITKKAKADEDKPIVDSSESDDKESVQ